jgi:hypothetical protein
MPAKTADKTIATLMPLTAEMPRSCAAPRIYGIAAPIAEPAW